MFEQSPLLLDAGLRVARPEDYDSIAAVLDRWWGRPMLDALPRLFLDHFHTTSLIAPGAGDGPPRAFLVGLLSPSLPDEAYIHFVGVTPSERGGGLGRLLYETFFAAARAAGRTTVSAVTAPVNTGSVRFHRAMGFVVEPPRPEHNGPGHPLHLFRRAL